MKKYLLIIFIAIPLLWFLIKKPENFGAAGTQVCAIFYDNVVGRGTVDPDVPIIRKNATIIAQNMIEARSEREGTLNKVNSDILDWHIDKYQDSPSIERTPRNILKECVSIFGYIPAPVVRTEDAASAPKISPLEIVLNSAFKNYDNKNKCWITESTSAGKKYCMELSDAHSFSDKENKRYHAILSGKILDESTQALGGSHGDSGAIAAVIADFKDGKAIIVAKSEAIEMGSFGEAPSKWSFTKIGHKNWAWINTSGFSGFGMSSEKYNIIAVRGAAFSNISEITALYSDSGSCGDEKCEKSATELNSSIIFDDSNKSAPYYNAVIKVTGRKGAQLFNDTRYTSVFDSSSGFYKDPLDTPFE